MTCFANPARQLWIRIRGGSASSPLARNTVSMLVGQVSRLVVQAFYFVLMARNLGPHQYGAFVAVAAVAAIVGPFVGCGSGLLMVKNVARDASVFAEYWGNTLLMTLSTGVLFSFLAIVGGAFALPGSIPPAIIVLVTISDVLLWRFVEAGMWAFQARERMEWTAGLNVFSSATRMAGIAAIILLHRPTLMAWAVAYAISTILCSTVAVGSVLWKLGAPKLGLEKIPGELREGFYFSIGLSSLTIYNDIDKTMLARLGTLDANGVYAAAYRLIDVAFVPVRSLLAAAYPAFFRNGQDGLSGSLAFAKRLLPRAAAYSAAMAIALFVAAPMVPWALGYQYDRTTEALRWLALLPLIKTLHYFAADPLSGAGHQGLRTFAQVSVALFNVGLNLWLIPLYSWRGAAWSSVASDGLLALMLWGCAAILLRRRQTVIEAREIVA